MCRLEIVSIRVLLNLLKGLVAVKSQAGIERVLQFEDFFCSDLNV